tara:strand:- start:91 stop:354 length:264 start_codon:yes stop_codon:yes gene_type:complete
MPGVTRAYQDTAGNVILRGASNVLINGLPVALRGAPVAGHGKSPHSGPIIIASSSTVYANGIGVVRQGDAASCGHTDTGSPNVMAGG